jgi:sorbitol-6-phosphate 2-dehydrogenase
VNVSDETSVGEMIRETVLSYGGLDLLVSNAGVLKAGSLEELDLQSFEFVNRINYTGFFLCCKYASQTMKIQHNFQSDYFMDIVQINSKSGLSGSNKNFAYAGSKFGGIGLTQSFALELVQFNIKVNAICPGNFFDGPLWSDPKHGLFVQYLRTGKVPGARSIEEVRRFYESKVPMKRGCRVEDVARALLYIVNQTYETGQAMPVTGGQIMLK